jgi:hypothetical protein
MMIFSLPLIAALVLSPVQVPGGAGGAMRLNNTRLTYGEFGAIRVDNKYLPGDVFYLAFDVEGITLDKQGKVIYSMGMEMTDPKGNSVFKQTAVDREEFLPLGGNQLPARAYLSLGTALTPGIYACSVTITDRATKAAKTLTQNIEILPNSLGIIAAYLSNDQKGEIATAPIGVVGQSLWVNFAVIGFQRNGKKQPDLDIQMIAFEKGKQILEAPITSSFTKEVDPEAFSVAIQHLLPLSRPGEFTVEFRATDNISKKVTKVTIPLRVLQSADR